ncbi:MAG: hypothetical protein ACKO1L_11750 [Brachymonas sp.]
MFIRSTLFGLLSLLLNGCSTVQPEGYSTRRYFGWLEVTQHQPIQGQATIERVKAAGLKLGPAFGMGYFDDSVIAISPQCKVVIALKNPEQMQEFAKQFPTFMKESQPRLHAIDF